MKVSEIQRVLDAKVYNEVDDEEELEVDYGYSCDLMSDVLAFAQNNDVLLTGTVNPQVIRTCQMVDIRVIVFVRAKSPTPELIELATRADILVMGTDHSLYVASSLLYQAGLPGEVIENDF